MAAGFVVFVLGKKYLEGHGEPPAPEVLKEKVVGPINREWGIYALGLLGVIPVFFLVQYNNIVGLGLLAAIVLSLAYIVFFLTRLQKVERERMMLAMVLILGAVVFFTLFEQAGD